MRDKVKRYSREFALLLAILVAVHFYQTRHHASGPAKPQKAQLIDGTEVTLFEPAGEAIILHFWATWCGVCRAEEDNLQRLSESYRVLSVASRSGSDEQIQRYMKEHGLTFPVVQDREGALAQRLGVSAYPTSFFLASDGRIITSVTGYTTTLGLRLRLWFAGL